MEDSLQEEIKAENPLSPKIYKQLSQKEKRALMKEHYQNHMASWMIFLVFSVVLMTAALTLRIVYWALGNQYVALDAVGLILHTIAMIFILVAAILRHRSFFKWLKENKNIEKK